MGQKTHPYSFRLGVSTDWKSKWFSNKDYVHFVNEDWRIRDYLKKELIRGAVSRVDIERTRDRLIVDIHTARPGVVIGRKGAEAERLRRGRSELHAAIMLELDLLAWRVAQAFDETVGPDQVHRVPSSSGLR